MQHKTYALVLVSLLDLALLFDLMTGLVLTRSVDIWCALHIVFAAVGVVLLVHLLVERANEASLSVSTNGGLNDGDHQVAPAYSLQVFIALFALTLPGVGLGGIALAMAYGLHASKGRSYSPDYWKTTPLAALPYVAPVNRQPSKIDSRGFTEHVLYSTNDNDVYNKVLASANVRISLAVHTLKQAMQHNDEKVRLTAYKTLDRKVTLLNKKIQRLEQELNADIHESTSDRWLQIASNYWELVTLEGSEAVAREQLLSKAERAAIKAVALLPENRNAHLVLGRISLAQGNTRRAIVALERSQALGMPADKVLPYLAECAFLEKDLHRVKSLLSKLDSSFIAYPPLSHVARYWA